MGFQFVILSLCGDNMSKPVTESPHLSYSACPPPSTAALLSCGDQNNRFHGKVMGNSAYIFSRPFIVVQPLEKEVAKALTTHTKSSEETSMNPCVLAQLVLGSQS